MSDHAHWLYIASTFCAPHSPDPRTKVGCILHPMSPGGRIYRGWNRMPEGIPDLPDIWENRDPFSDRLCKYDLVVHAEQDALSQVPRGGRWRLYCTHQPCARCAAAIVHHGVEEVWYLHPLDPITQAGARPAQSEAIFRARNIPCTRFAA